MLTAALATGSCIAAPGSAPNGGTAAAFPASAPIAPAPAVAPTFVPVYTDEFSGTQLDGRWSVYSGTPSSDTWAKWDPARVSVADGRLVLGAAPVPGSPGRWTTGGVSNWRNAQLYGRWSVRFRATTSSIQSYHFLLWPTSESWPPEVDLAESWDPSRRRTDGFVHWRDAGGVRRKTASFVSGTFTDWNTVTVTWTPDEVSYALNGTVWARVTGAAVPREQMWLALQTETQICDRGRSSCATDTLGTPSVEIDSVTVESYAG